MVIIDIDKKNNPALPTLPIPFCNFVLYLFSFIARAHSPTVTMPRVKALMTGGIPGFVDVILNSVSSSLQEDSLPMQIVAAGKKILFFGDDTWMKLFPGHFLRSDGTTSFFVTDYTEVYHTLTIISSRFSEFNGCHDN